MATIIHSFRRDIPLGCGLNAVNNFSYNQTFNEEDEYEPDYIDEDDDVQQVANEVTNVAPMKEDEYEYEPQWGIDDYDDDDDEVQEVTRFEYNEVEGVVDAMKDNKIEGIVEEHNTKVFYQDNSVNDNGFRYLTGDEEGCQDVYSEYLFMVSEQEDYFVSDFGNGKNCFDLNTSKRRKVSECSDGRRRAPESGKDGQGEIVLALAAPQFCPWIDSKGILKKHRQRARKPQNHDS